MNTTQAAADSTTVQQLPAELAQSVLNFDLFELGGTPITVGSVVTALLILVIASVVSRVVRRLLKRAMTRSRVAAAEGTVNLAQRILHYSIMLVAFGIAMDTIGIDLGALFAAGAIFAVALGFAMQNIAQNFTSGVILILERSVKAGDILEVDGTVVRVREMGMRSTLARTRDDEDLIIPNSRLVQTTVKNFTLRDSLYRLRALVGVSYDSDMNLVRQVLTDVVEPLEWRSRGRVPRILLTEFGSSSVNFEVSVWMSDPWEARPALSKLYHAIWDALKEAGITIAYPQVDVHVDVPVADALDRIAGGGA